MKIAVFMNLKLLEEVVYRNEIYTVIDCKRNEHMAQLKGGKFTGGKWVRCSEFDYEKDLSPTRRKQIVARQVMKQHCKGLRCCAVNVHKAKRLVFDTNRACAKHFGITIYRLRKAIQEFELIDGYEIYNLKEKMEIQDYRNRLEECRAALIKAMQGGDSLRIMHFQREVDWYEAKVKELEGDEKNLNAMLHGDPVFGQMMGKTLSLMLNEADMAIYHLDIYFAALKAHGLVDRAKDWTNRKLALRKALREFAEIPDFMLQGEIRKKNREVLADMIGQIRDGYYNQKEQVLYDKYEELSNEY